MVCVYNKIEMWIFIVKKFLYLFLERDYDNWFIYYVVVRCGNFEILKIIIDDNYDIDINFVDKYGRIILYIVCFYGKFDVCKFFVLKFFNMVKERDVYGNLVCVLVVRGGNLNVYKLFFEILNLFFNEEDWNNLFDVVNLLKNDLVINFLGDNYYDVSLF